MNGSAEPGRDCPLCPRLVAYRNANQAAQPAWFNGAVPSFGDPAARLAVVGLAPGVTGANRTGRPFTGDAAGELLYATLLRHGFAQGRYAAAPDDGLRLQDCLITNAVRCVPPQNKPTPDEIRTCNGFLRARLETMANLRVVVALGRIAHDAVLRACALKSGAAAFAHGARHALPRFVLADSFHCSRYNTNTGKLTPEMFDAVFADVRRMLTPAAA